RTPPDPHALHDALPTSHPTIPQLAFSARLAGWVAPEGTLLVVAHRHGHGHHPHEATVTAGDVRAQLEQDGWVVDVAEEVTRAVQDRKSTRLNSSHVKSS